MKFDPVLFRRTVADAERSSLPTILVAQGRQPTSIHRLPPSSTPEIQRVSELTKTKWLAGLADLTARLQAISRTAPDSGLRAAIVEVWHVMATAPGMVSQFYERTSEADLILSSGQIVVQTAHPTFGLPDCPGDAPAVVISWLGSCLRALEAELFHNDLGEAPVDPNSDWRVELDNEAFLLIPVPKRPWQAIKDPASDFRTFAQRGLGMCRIVPVEIGGATVRVTWLDQAPPSPASPAFGAVLFDTVEYDEDTDDKTFLITGVRGGDMAGVAGAAVRKAHAQPCAALVFPELTVDDDLLEVISRTLATKEWTETERSEIARSPSLVVAGSWHRPEGEVYANTAVVLDGYGETVLKHRKRFVFKDRTGRAERIEPGTALDLLVTAEAIYTFGICLDFCTMAHETSYGPLNVDFVLVPSCGGETTMKSHIAKAGQLLVERKTRTFVVQQAYPALAEGMGYVLNPVADPGAHSPQSLISTENCSFFDAQGFL